MRIPLQSLDHHDSQYERPNQDWICGWSRDGRPCTLGPNDRGHCTAHGQGSCEPAREGDRYLCTRADVFGGPCSEGPRPDGSCVCPHPEHEVCQPVRSLRARRKLAVRLSLALTLGILLIGLAGPWSLAFISPGPLSASHMAIQGTGDQNCVACHVAQEASFGAWIDAATQALTSQSHGDQQSEQCLTCHFRSQVQQATALTVHNRDLTALAAITGAVPVPASGGGLTATSVNLARMIHGSSDYNSALIPCAACHEEHRGQDHEMTVMSDAECQVCHQKPFESFNLGHPDFGSITPTGIGISFNHQKHAARLTDETLICSSCHMPDEQGKTMAVAPFETACQGCHAQGSRDHHGDGIKRNSLLFLQLPELEFDEPVYWPTDGAWGEQFSPMMLLLLAGDEDAVPILYDISEDAYGDLFEWGFILEDNDELYRKAELAAVIKRLVAELADYTDAGVDARNERLAKALGVPATSPVVQNLAAELNSASFVMQMFKQRYLPQLKADLAGKTPAPPDDVAGANDWMTSRNMVGWHVDSAAGTISYRPVAHADPLLKHWIEAVFAMPSAAAMATPVAEQRQYLRDKVVDEIAANFKACTRCHSLGDGGVSWQAGGRHYAASGFVKFNHAPHMAMLNEGDTCKTCHVQTVGGADNNSSMVRGFAPHEKAVCASCHNSTSVDNSCTSCHQYHEVRP